SIFGQPAWFLRNQTETGFGLTPIAGFSAYNGFDGSPGTFFLKQTFTLSSWAANANLSFSFKTAENYGNFNRTFDAYILDASTGSIVANPYHFILPYSGSTTQTVSLDITNILNSIGPGTYQLEFLETIPQNFTGPATFEIDNISLQMNPNSSPPQVLS